MTLPPQWTQVPPVVLDAFCTKLRNEGVSPDTIFVVKTTQPLVTGASLGSVGHLYGKSGEVGSFAAALSAVLSDEQLYERVRDGAKRARERLRTWEEAGDDLEERGLAAAHHSDDRHKFSPLDAQRRVSQHLTPITARPEALGDAT